MAAFKRVIDYMAGMPDSANHRELYYKKFMEREGTRQIKQINGVDVEKTLIAPGERNIIGALSIQLKFTLSGFNKGFWLNGMSTVRTRDGGKDRLDIDNKYMLDFCPTRTWALLPATASVTYPVRDTALNIVDKEQRRIVMASCNSLSSADTYGLAMVTVTEKLGLPTDLRHLFTKMYLLMMDYNLAVTSKVSDIEVDPDTSHVIYPNAGDAARLAAVVDHNIVVDAEGFTAEELGLLVLAGQQYPPVWYAGDNIYNACQMEADDLAIISDRDIHVDGSMRWGSPDRLYNLIWGIAAKFGAVDCLTAVISDMRGRPKMISDMLKRTDIVAIASDMPLSRCLVKAFGDRPGIGSAVGRYPGYLSTSMSLVSDLLYGMMFEASASCLVEELGGIGNAVSGKDPMTHRTFNGLLRDYGLDHGDLEVNSLLINWMSLTGTPIMWGFGRQLKKYVLTLASEIVNDMDILMPQLVELIPYMSSHNTTWGCGRGWTGKSRPLDSTKDERKLHDQQVASVAWLVGQRKVRPKVFRNQVSSKDIVLGMAEYNLRAACPNGCVVESIGLWLGQDVGGRVDENEETSSALVRTEYSGTKCSFVYDRDSKEWRIPLDKKPDYTAMVKESFSGKPPPLENVEIRPVTFGGSPKPEDQFNSLKALASTKINVASKAVYARTSPSGEVYVPQYLMDEERGSRLQIDHPFEAHDGETLTFGEVTVPFDGQCAVHAVMEDLKMHGYVSQDGLNRARNAFTSELTTGTWHDANEVAAILGDWGFGLDLIDVQERGTRLMRFGDVQSDNHRVGLIRRGNHFNAAKIGKGKNTITIDKVDQGQVSMSDFADRIREVRKVINFNR
nr:hypothetical protein [Aspergillus ochraceopetaliformis chrysovirus 1]